MTYLVFGFENNCMTCLISSILCVSLQIMWLYYFPNIAC